MGFRPVSEQELAKSLADCAAAHRTIRLGGHFSKASADGADVTVSTCAMRRVLQYEPRDLTISVEAGMPWVELTELLAANRQMVPLDPPWFDSCTAGGVVATNISGPRRRLYGTARDLVIGMRFATLEGKVVQTGGMVVKNVAGLDMAKLLVGSWGTLAAIAVVNFKLNPMPPATKTFCLEFVSAAEVKEACSRVMQSVLQPAAIDLLNPAAASAFDLSDRFVLLLQAGGSPAVLDRYTKALPEARAVDCEIWSRIREFVPRFGARKVLSSDALKNPKPVVVRAGSGVAYAAGAPDSGPQGSEIMTRVKHLFDPEGLLNP